MTDHRASCPFCRAMDSLVAGFCHEHRRARINYDTPQQKREAILAMAVVFGYDVRGETKGRPEL